MSVASRPGTGLLLHDVVNDRWIFARCDPNGVLFVSAVIPGVVGVDVTDRWARQLGQVDLARVLGAALTVANPVIVGVYDAAGNRMPAMDAAGRPGYVDVIDRWARLLGQVDLARVLGAALTAANPVIVGLFDAAGNRMPAMDIAARPGFVDVIDRAARLLGIVYGSQGQQLLQRAATFDLIVQLRSGGAEIDPRDVTDRWARQLGQVDLARVLGVALSTANPVIAGIFDAAGNRMPSMDAAARPGYVDVIDRWARQLGQVDLARVLGAALTAANPVITGVFDAAGNRMPAMDADARRGYVDITPPGSLFQGTRTTTVAAGAIAISAAPQAVRRGVLVQADIDNTGRILIGNNVAQPIELEHGNWVSIPCDDVQDVFFNVTVDNERVNWLAA